MKKVFFLFACLSVFALSAQAQKACAKTCTKSKKVTMAQGAAASVDDAVIAKAASLDDSIERKVCDKSGAVSYHMNYKCAETGKMTSKQVTYDASTAKFVNYSPSKAEGTAKKACCAAGAKKACCAGGKKACSKTKSAATKAAAKEAKSSALKVSNSSSMQ